VRPVRGASLAGSGQDENARAVRATDHESRSANPVWRQFVLARGEHLVVDRERERDCAMLREVCAERLATNGPAIPAAAIKSVVKVRFMFNLLFPS
jgi:hypothetical protein